MRLGIDFGTTHTVVSRVDSGNYPVASFDSGDHTAEYIPTVAAVDRGRVRYGWEAVDAAARGRGVLLRSMKRAAARYRPEEPVPVGPGVDVPLLELLAGFLGHVRTMIRECSNLAVGDGPLEAMVATPANANSNQRYVTVEAFRRAGFVVLEVMNEPSAAALEYVHRYLRDLGPRSPKQHVVVYDMGGGTFDTAAVRFADRSYEVLHHEGIARLGGQDFDRILLEHALAEAGIPMDTVAPERIPALLEECRERKEGLTARSRKLAVDLGGEAEEDLPTVVLDTAGIYAACEPLIRPSVEAVARVVSELAPPGEDEEDTRHMAGVYLVGGSAAFPPVARMLREAFGRKIRKAPAPHAATAIGLAVAADPEARIRVRESATRHFGVWREHAEGRDKVFDTLIPKHTRLGAGEGLTVERSYQPRHNIGHLRFMECGALNSDGQPAGDLNPWPDIWFPYDPELQDDALLERSEIRPRPDLSQHAIRETYAYEANGIIRVRIENVTAGYRREYTLGQSV